MVSMTRIFSFVEKEHNSSMFFAKVYKELWLLYMQVPLAFHSKKIQSSVANVKISKFMDFVKENIVPASTKEYVAYSTKSPPIARDTLSVIFYTFFSHKPF